MNKKNLTQNILLGLDALFGIVSITLIVIALGLWII